jgi:hypothetical protein
LLPPGVRSVDQAVKLARRPIPSWPFTLWGAPSSCRGTGFPAPPLVCLANRSPKATAHAHCRVFTCRRPGISPCGAPAPLGFATSSRGPPCGCLACR